MMRKIILIGSGNVATHLGAAFYNSGIEVLQVWSRHLENAKELANKIESEGIDDYSKLRDDADGYIISVKDDAMLSVLEAFPFSDKMLIHTAGSVSADLLKPYAVRYGVFYPLQTFSKAKGVDFKQIPILLEASDNVLLEEMEEVATLISDNVKAVTSEQRRYLHIAAVFACNFTNHLFAIAEDILGENDLSFDFLRPLILETATKAMIHSPKIVQTGPAARKDVEIVNSHLEMLSDNPELQNLYELLSKRIMMNSSNNPT